MRPSELEVRRCVSSLSSRLKARIEVLDVVESHFWEFLHALHACLSGETAKTPLCTYSSMSATRQLTAQKTRNFNPDSVPP